MKSLNDYPHIMSAKDIAEYMGMSYAKALHLLKYGNLPCIKVGHIFKISRAAFETWVNEPIKNFIA